MASFVWVCGRFVCTTDTGARGACAEGYLGIAPLPRHSLVFWGRAGREELIYRYAAKATPTTSQQVLTVVVNYACHKRAVQTDESPTSTCPDGQVPLSLTRAPHAWACTTFPRGGTAHSAVHMRAPSTVAHVVAAPGVGHPAAWHAPHVWSCRLHRQGMHEGRVGYTRAPAQALFWLSVRVGLACAPAQALFRLCACGWCAARGGVAHAGYV